MKTAIISMSALATLTAVGARFEWNIVPYMVFGAVCAVAVLVALGKIKPKAYPIYIFGMSLALLWQTSMLGGYIVGTDIHGEIFVVNRAIAQGWDFSFADPSNTSLVIGGLAPGLAKIGISPVWQFKLLYPMVFACVPMILYFAYRKMMGEQRAFWASVFFMILPVFFVEIIGIVKSMTAEVFLALMILLLVVDIKTWMKAVGVGVCIAAAMLCHYTVGVLAIVCLVGGLFVLLASKPIRLGFLKNRHIPLWVLTAVLVPVISIGVVWSSFAGDGLMMRYYKKIATGLVGQVSLLMPEPSTEIEVSAPITVVPASEPEADEPIPPVSTPPETGEAEPQADGTPSSTPSESEADDAAPPTSVPPEETTPPSADESAATSETTPETTPEATPEQQEPPSQPSYLYQQEPLAQTAIGLDFASATPWGKAFRIVQYLTQFLLIAGTVYLLFRYRRYRFTAEFMACMVVGWVLLALCVFYPTFSSMINASRFYQISLFFLAPMLVVGVEGLAGGVGKLRRLFGRGSE